MRDIGHIREAAADAWIGGALPGEVLLAEASGQRRAEVEALAGNGRQLTFFDEADALAQVWSMSPGSATPAPGKVRKVVAMLLGGARASKAGVSYQLVAVREELLRMVS